MAKYYTYKITFKLKPTHKQQTMKVVSNNMIGLRERCRERIRKGWWSSFTIIKLKKSPSL